MDRSEIEKLAELACIEINDATAAEAARSITEVLALVDQMREVSTDNVEPMAHPLDAQQRLRRDEVTEADRRDAFQAIAPAVEARLYLVPKVIE